MLGIGVIRGDPMYHHTIVICRLLLANDTCGVPCRDHTLALAMGEKAVTYSINGMIARAIIEKLGHGAAGDKYSEV